MLFPIQISEVRGPKGEVKLRDIEGIDWWVVQDDGSPLLVNQIEQITVESWGFFDVAATYKMTQVKQ